MVGQLNNMNVLQCSFVTRSMFVMRGLYNDGCKSLSLAEFYDIPTQKWTKLPEMNKKRSVSAAAIVANRKPILGGYHVSDCHASCECLIFFLQIPWRYVEN